MKLKVPVTHQHDGHTCGYCAARSAYRYYGLDPDALELREYLGTDHILPYNLPCRDRIEEWMGGTEHMLSGTWPMDRLAVLYWDGFDVETVTAGYTRCRDRLSDHLENGDLALTMVYDCLHWVVVSGMDEKGVWIVDGCFTDDDLNDSGRKTHTYRLSHERFAAEMHGLLLLSRDDEPDDPLIREMTYPDFVREYGRGLAFSATTLGKKIPHRLVTLLCGSLAA